MKMTMTATGDSILIQGYQEGGYPGFQEICDYIAKGQARIGNLETCITEWDTYCSAYCGGTWLNTTPRVLDQILGFGMNFIGFANNHSMDFGPDGLLETVDNVKKRGVAITGAGKDLADAAQPVYRDFPGGRVAFISVASTISDDAARAAYASKTLPGRPGVNGLRYSTTMYVNREHFEKIQEITAATGINGSADIARKTGFSSPLPEGVADFGGIRVRLHPEGKEYKDTTCNKRDLERVLDAIKDAQYIADYVVIMFHGHEIHGEKNSTPALFHEEFAHACIDAGACAVIGTGTHEFKPMEIYNGKPIFYSLGNFCFQSNVLERQPNDMLDKFNFPEVSDVQALAMRNKAENFKWTVGLHTQYYNFRTVIPYLEFEDGKLTHVEMKPVELGFDKPRTFKGVPYPANEAVSKEIFETLRELSLPYGTKMKLEEGLIQVEL